MSSRTKKVARRMAAAEKKAVIAVKQAVNNQPLRKRIICGRW